MQFFVADNFNLYQVIAGIAVGQRCNALDGKSCGFMCPQCKLDGSKLLLCEGRQLKPEIRVHPEIYVPSGTYEALRVLIYKLSASTEIAEHLKIDTIPSAAVPVRLEDLQAKLGESRGKIVRVAAKLVRNLHNNMTTMFSKVETCPVCGELIDDDHSSDCGALYIHTLMKNNALAVWKTVDLMSMFVEKQAAPKK